MTQEKINRLSEIITKLSLYTTDAISYNLTCEADNILQEEKKLNIGSYDAMRKLINNIADSPYALTPDQWAAESREVLAGKQN